MRGTEVIFWLAWNHFDHKTSESGTAAIARVDAGLPTAIRPQRDQPFQFDGTLACLTAAEGKFVTNG